MRTEVETVEIGGTRKILKKNLSRKIRTITSQCTRSDYLKLRKINYKINESKHYD